jgi:hypothetical protein
MRSSSRSKSSLKSCHRNTTNATFEMAHNLFFKSKKFEIFTTSTYQRSQRSLKGMFTFFRVMCTCELNGLGEWLLVVEKSKV